MTMFPVLNVMNDRIGGLEGHNIKLENKNLVVVMLDDEYYGTFDLKRNMFVEDIERIEVI